MRSSAIVSMKRRSALTAAGLSPGMSSGARAASHTGAPIVSPCASTLPSEVAPIPRLGEFAARLKLTRSDGLASRDR